MPEAADLPFAFLRDMLAQADEPYADEGSPRPVDPAAAGAKAALFDATIGVLAAFRQLFQAAEDLVRVKRDRLGAAASDTPPNEPTPQPPGRERLDLSY